MDNDLRQKISALFVVPSELSEYTECEEIYVGTSSNPYTFQLYYNPDTASAEAIAKMCDELEAVYQYFITSLGFEKPYTEGNLYRVYLVNDDYFVPSVAGVNVPIGSGKSYVVIKCSNTDSEAYKEVTSHEYHHAIQRLYGVTSTEKWVVEGMATCASLLYAGYASAPTAFREKLLGYLTNTNYSLDTLDKLDMLKETTSAIDKSAPYGTFVHFLYIYNTFSGWSTIQSMYRNVANGDSIYDAISNIPGISSFAAIFAASLTRCVDPSKFFSQLSSCSAKLKCPYYSGLGIETILDFDVSPTSSHTIYFTPSMELSECNLYFNIESSNPVGMTLNSILILNNNSSPTITTHTNRLTRVSFYQYISGEPFVNRFYLFPVNTNTEGSPVSVSITVSPVSAS